MLAVLCIDWTILHLGIGMMANECALNRVVVKNAVISHKICMLLGVFRKTKM